tara:strand:- start:1090 stop:1374 length:285 start_codon:yes stop_codon:yes gene_type:complete
MSYIPVHQVWTYVQYKPKPEQVISAENDKEKPVDKTRHVVQMTRIRKKFDIITLAKMTGTTPTALSKYEKGQDILSKEVLEQLFKILEIPMNKN